MWLTQLKACKELVKAWILKKKNQLCYEARQFLFAGEFFNFSRIFPQVTCHKDKKRNSTKSKFFEKVIFRSIFHEIYSDWMEETLNEKKIQPNNRESQENSNVRVPIPCKISNEPSVNHTIRNAIDVLDNQNANR